jgi:hypothetical protein
VLGLVGRDGEQRVEDVLLEGRLVCVLRVVKGILSDRRSNSYRCRDAVDDKCKYHMSAGGFVRSRSGSSQLP